MACSIVIIGVASGCGNVACGVISIIHVGAVAACVIVVVDTVFIGVFISIAGGLIVLGDVVFINIVVGIGEIRGNDAVDYIDVLGCVANRIFDGGVLFVVSVFIIVINIVSGEIVIAGIVKCVFGDAVHIAVVSDDDISFGCIAVVE